MIRTKYIVVRPVFNDVVVLIEFLHIQVVRRRRKKYLHVFLYFFVISRSNSDTNRDTIRFFLMSRHGTRPVMAIRRQD